MSVADLYNVPRTKEEFAEWSSLHLWHHRDVIAYAQRTKNKQLPLFAIDPFNIQEPGVALYQHQLMHANNQQLFSVQGVGFDLLDVNLNDPESWAQWVYLNAQTHYAEAAATGVW